MTTVLLLNPMGSDVTWAVPTLLKGRFHGMPVVTVKYNNQSGVENIAAGVEALHAALLAATGDVIIFAYSQGCGVAYRWLREHGGEIDPERVSLILIGNAERKYGGFSAGKQVYSDVGDVDGLPDDCAYRVTDFVRQWDPVGDFPSSPKLQAALHHMAPGSDIAAAIRSVASVVTDSVETIAGQNVLSGLALIHNWYFDVGLDDPQNVWLQEGNVRYGWAPTYPAPIVAGWSWLPSIMAQQDQKNRPLIERCFDRPVELPSPSYTSPLNWI